MTTFARSEALQHATAPSTGTRERTAIQASIIALKRRTDGSCSHWRRSNLEPSITICERKNAMLMMKVDVPSVTPITAESVSGSVLMGVVPRSARVMSAMPSVCTAMPVRSRRICASRFFPESVPFGRSMGGCHAMAQCL